MSQSPMSLTKSVVGDMVMIVWTSNSRRVDHGQEAIQVDTRYALQCDNVLACVAKVFFGEKCRVLVEKVAVHVVQRAIVKLGCR